MAILPGLRYYGEMASASVERIRNGKPEVFPLAPAKAARFKAQTMLVPSPNQVREAISAIPYGSTKTLRQIREELAAASGADVTCPYVAGVCWRLVAEDGRESPWWRVTADGKTNPKLPGGAERHQALLAEEAGK